MIQVELVACVMAVRSACRIWVGKIQGKKTWRSGRLMLHVTTFVQKMEAGGFSTTLVPVYQTPWHYISQDIISLLTIIKSPDSVLTIIIIVTL